MAPLATLAAADVRRVLERFSELLDSYREVINRLNVYPVPDGDTGTNMSLTVASVVTELGQHPEAAAMADVCAAVAHGSLMGARGNSGVILSQLLRGIAETCRTHEVVTPAVLAEALAHADRLARQAVVRPVEGTILTISRAAAEGAADADDLCGLVRGARDASRAALERTPEMLPVLAQAGVVDAGGAGLCLLLDAMCNVVAGDALPAAPPVERIQVHAPEIAAQHGDGAETDLRYEVMYFLETSDHAVGEFKSVWAGIGDSIVVVGGDGLYNCHIHTDDVGAAIEAALDVGRPRGIRVTDLAEQVIEERWVREGAFDQVDEDQGPAPQTAVVAVVQGDGIGRIFRSLGVRGLVTGGQSMNPSTAQLLAAVAATGSIEVVLLPNNKNIVPVAHQVAELSETQVHVVATASIVEGFAALLAYDPGAPGESNATAMAASAEHVIAAEVTQAVRDTTTEAGEVREGDWIGLDRSGVRSIAESVAVAACALLEAVVVAGEHDLVTVIEGEGATPANTRRITQWLAEERPGVAVEVHHGGQRLYPYLFGVE